MLAAKRLSLAERFGHRYVQRRMRKIHKMQDQAHHAPLLCRMEHARLHPHSRSEPLEAYC
jgi:ribosomal protein L37AE/L43A